MKTCVACNVTQPRSNFYRGLGRCKACKKEYDRDYRKANRGKQLQMQRDRRSSPEGYVDRFMERIKLRTPDTDIDRSFFADKMSSCPFTGMTFSYVNSYNCYHNPTAPSVDRIDSNKGYYKENTQVILSCINRMKNDLPEEDFKKLWAALMNVEGE